MRTWHFSNFYFFYFATIGIIMPYWSLYLQHTGFSATEIGQLMAIFLFTKMLAPNIWASVADHMVATKGGSLRILKFATLATVIVYALMYLVTGFWDVAFVMFAYCVFWNASLPQLEAATLNHLGDKRQYGRVRLWGSLGFIATVAGLGLVMDFVGPAAILPAGGLALVALFFASLLMRDGAAQPSIELSSTIALRKLLNTKVLALLSLCFFMQLSHAPLQTFLSIYLEDYGYSKWQIGLLWTTGVVFEIIVFIFAYQILGRFRLSSLLSFTFLVASIRWCLVSQYPDIPLVVFVTQAMHSVTFGLYHTVMIQLIDRMFVGRYQIRGQALYSSLTFGLGGAIGSFVSGYIWVDFGKQELFLMSGILMAVVFLISVLVTSRLTGEASS